MMLMIAFVYAVANGVSGRFNSDKKMAGKDWLPKTKSFIAHTRTVYE
jgi:hypothetical protein